jgi:hypothetical protein
MDYAEVDEPVACMRGGDEELGVDLEHLLNAVASARACTPAAFMDAHGVPSCEDEADTADADDEESAYTVDELNQPLHAHTTTTVKEAAYTIMTAGAGVRQKPLDELIKAFKALLPPGNLFPGCA